MKLTLDSINHMQAASVIDDFAIGLGATRDFLEGVVSKPKLQARMAAFSFSEKIKILEKLRAP